MNKILTIVLTTSLLVACQKGNVTEYGTSDYTEESFSAGVDEQLNDSYLTEPAPRYIIGNNYNIEDIQYTPIENYSYNEIGMVGIIPEEMNGRQTVNGEIFDINKMYATSKTLPLPTIARLTNLENGQYVKVRINNRGPFVNTRIMDVSPAVAQKLGISSQAKVKIQVLEDESKALKSATLGISAPQNLTEESLDSSVKDNTEISNQDNNVNHNNNTTYDNSGEYTVQLAAFNSEESANALANSMNKYGNTKVMLDNGLYKVRITGLDAYKAKETIKILRQNEGMTPGLLKNNTWINADSI